MSLDVTAPIPLRVLEELWPSSPTTGYAQQLYGSFKVPVQCQHIDERNGVYLISDGPVGAVRKVYLDDEDVTGSVAVELDGYWKGVGPLSFVMVGAGETGTVYVEADGYPETDTAAQEGLFVWARRIVEELGGAEWYEVGEGWADAQKAWQDASCVAGVALRDAQPLGEVLAELLRPLPAMIWLDKGRLHVSLFDGQFPGRTGFSSVDIDDSRVQNVIRQVAEANLLGKVTIDAAQNELTGEFDVHVEQADPTASGLGGREIVIEAPWLQDQTTAQAVAGWWLGVAGGLGIETVDAELADPGLLVLGPADTVNIDGESWFITRVERDVQQGLVRVSGVRNVS